MRRGGMVSGERAALELWVKLNPDKEGVLGKLYDLDSMPSFETETEKYCFTIGKTRENRGKPCIKNPMY